MNELFKNKKPFEFLNYVNAWMRLQEQSFWAKAWAATDSLCRSHPCADKPQSQDWLLQWLMCSHISCSHGTTILDANTADMERINIIHRFTIAYS